MNYKIINNNLTYENLLYLVSLKMAEVKIEEIERGH
jgi:hypothetical protein